MEVKRQPKHVLTLKIKNKYSPTSGDVFSYPYRGRSTSETHSKETYLGWDKIIDFIEILCFVPGTLYFHWIWVWHRGHKMEVKRQTKHVRPPKIKNKYSPTSGDVFSCPYRGRSTSETHSKGTSLGWDKIIDFIEILGFVPGTLYFH